MILVVATWVPVELGLLVLYTSGFGLASLFFACLVLWILELGYTLVMVPHLSAVCVCPIVFHNSLQPFGLAVLSSSVCSCCFSMEVKKLLSMSWCDMLDSAPELPLGI